MKSNLFDNGIFMSCRSLLFVEKQEIEVVNADGDAKQQSEKEREAVPRPPVDGALVIMNGVPDSPINRYDQVVDSIQQLCTALCWQ